MFGGSKKPFTAVTVQIEHLTSEEHGEDEWNGLIALIEVIRIQPTTGPTEAARALRKAFKYGNTHRQLRALTILDYLIQNDETADSRLHAVFTDDALLGRLRLMARDEVTSTEVKQRCKVLFKQWYTYYSKTPGLQGIASLYRELPKPQRPPVARPKEQSESEREPTSSYQTGRARASSSAKPLPSPASPVAAPHRPATLTPTSSSSFSFFKGKKEHRSGKPFDLSKEKEGMTTTIANASIASTNLLNGLQLINRETERVSSNQEVLRRFETCKTLRREILRYIQHVESDQWIGSLVNANDELVKALTSFEIMDKSVSDDSDSDWEQAEHKPQHSRDASSGAIPDFSGLSISETPPAKPPRPGKISMPPPPSSSNLKVPNSNQDAEEDEDDPFGDSNAAPTPRNELQGMTWKEV